MAARFFLGLFALVTAPVLGFACSNEVDDPYLAVDGWACFESEASGAGGEGGLSGGEGGSAGAGAPSGRGSCDCYGLSEGEEVSDPRPRVRQCSAESVDPDGWECCYAWPTPDDEYDCRCENAPLEGGATYCANAAVASGGEVVTSCPPTPRDDAAYCAFHGESCAPEYLEEHLLNGCCEGFVCRPDAHGVLVCHGD